VGSITSANPIGLNGMVRRFDWLALGARSEYALSTLKAALAGLSVRDGMITEFESLGPHEPLSSAVQHTLVGFQQDFPVMDGERLLGVLTHQALLRGLAEQGAEFSVRETMDAEVTLTSPAVALWGVLAGMRREGRRVLTVAENGRVVGLLRTGNVGELIALRAAGDARSHGHPTA
jgi:predicted transcriptional regulator